MAAGGDEAGGLGDGESRLVREGLAGAGAGEGELGEIEVERRLAGLGGKDLKGGTVGDDGFDHEGVGVGLFRLLIRLSDRALAPRRHRDLEAFEHHAIDETRAVVKDAHVGLERDVIELKEGRDVGAALEAKLEIFTGSFDGGAGEAAEVELADFDLTIKTLFEVFDETLAGDGFPILFESTREVEVSACADERKQADCDCPFFHKLLIDLCR